MMLKLGLSGETKNTKTWLSEKKLRNVSSAAFEYFMSGILWSYLVQFKIFMHVRRDRQVQDLIIKFYE